MFNTISKDDGYTMLLFNFILSSTKMPKGSYNFPFWCAQNKLASPSRFRKYNIPITSRLIDLQRKTFQLTCINSKSIKNEIF